MIKNRRKHPRLRIPLEAEYLVAGEEEWRQGTIWTLGAGGAALLCEEELPVGTVLEGLHFVVEAEGDLPETRIEVAAEVVNIDRKADYGRASNFMLGLRFTGLDEEETELLKQFVFRRLTASQGGAEEGPADGAAAGEEPTPVEIRFKRFDDFVGEISEHLSLSGMFIPAHRPLAPGAKFVFRFQLGDDFPLFQGTAEVVWNRRRSEGSARPAGMGVRFLNLDLTSQKLVKRLVQQQQGEEGPAAGASDEGDLEASAEGESSAPKEAPDDEAWEAAPAAPGKRVGIGKEPSRRPTRLERRLANAQAARDEAETGRAEAEERLARMGDEVEILQAENQALQGSLDEAIETCEQAQGEAAELRRELQARQPTAEVEERLSQLEKEAEGLREERRAVEEKLSRELETTASTEADLRQQLREATELESELRSEVAQTSSRESELRSRLERAEERVGELRREAAEAERERDATEKVLREQVEQLAGERDRLAGDLEAANRRLGRLRGAAEQMRSRFNGDLSAARELGNDLAAKLAEVVQVGAGLDAKVEQLTAARAGLEERLGRINQTWSTLEDGLEAGEPATDDTPAEEPEGPWSENASAGSGEDVPMAGAGELRTKAGRDSDGASAAEPEPSPAEAEAFAPEPAEDEAPVEARTGERAADEGERDIPDGEGSESSLGAVTWTAAAALDDERREALADDEADGESAGPFEEASRVSEVDEAAGEEWEAEPPEPAESGTPAIAEPPAAAGGRGLFGMARRAMARLGLGGKAPVAPAVAPVAEPVESEPETPLESHTETVAEAAEEPDAGPLEIEETVRAWAAAWSERRVEDYLAFYSSEFEPDRGTGEEGSETAAPAWLPPLAGMELTLGPISQVELAPDRFAVHFEQSVESNSYTRRTGRTLELVREADAWKIAAESFQELSG